MCWKCECGQSLNLECITELSNEIPLSEYGDAGTLLSDMSNFVVNCQSIGLSWMSDCKRKWWCSCVWWQLSWYCNQEFRLFTLCWWHSWVGFITCESWPCFWNSVVNWRDSLYRCLIWQATCACRSHTLVHVYIKMYAIYTCVHGLKLTITHRHLTP